MSRCKANPCCGDPVYCEVPLAQDRTGLYHLNGYSEPASPPSPSPTQHTGWSDEAVEVGTFIAASEHGVGVSWGDLGPLKSGDKLYAKAALTAASSIAPTTGFEVKHSDDCTWNKTRITLARRCSCGVLDADPISPSVSKESGEPGEAEAVLALRAIARLVEENIHDNGTEINRMMVDGEWHTGPVVDASFRIIKGLGKIARQAIPTPPEVQS